MTNEVVILVEDRVVYVDVVQEVFILAESAEPGFVLSVGGGGSGGISGPAIYAFAAAHG